MWKRKDGKSRETGNAGQLSGRKTTAKKRSPGERDGKTPSSRGIDRVAEANVGKGKGEKHFSSKAHKKRNEYQKVLTQKG